MSDNTGYVWDDRDTELEFARLDGQARLLDQLSCSRLASLSMGSGTRCLEVGPGTGSMTRWMVDQGWQVVALDISDRWFPAIRRDGVDLCVGDVRDVSIEGQFDVIFTRYVLHHLPQRAEVVEKLARALLPGGWLVADEPHKELMATVGGPDAIAFFREVLGRFSAYGVDYNCGASLPSLFSSAGLVNIDAVGGFPLVFPGSESVGYLTAALDALEQPTVSLGGYTSADFERRRSEVSGPDFVGTGAVNISCRGQRPT